MPKGTPDVFWKKSKNRNAFMNLCKESRKIGVDWKKFRKHDENGKFSEYTDKMLSQQFRKIRYQRANLCWVCGKNPPVVKRGTCRKCRKNFNRLQKERNKREL